MKFSAATEVLVPSSHVVTHVEGIQALREWGACEGTHPLVILSGWGQAGWRFSGHAFRLG